MDYDYIRQLTGKCFGEDARRVYEILSAGGFEIYVCGEDGSYVCAADGSADRFYISAADREAAAALLKEQGLARLVSEDFEGNVHKPDLVAEAEDAFYKKHKSLIGECLVVVVFVIVWWILRRI